MIQWWIAPASEASLVENFTDLKGDELLIEDLPGKV
ncbi:hypothetical protein EYZ11_004834 [Aspergillus tanneri]|uniref:Uncharacterized protein n=1 Tax=Aspergillus tanneri TaxID=1220188 RepID=A0A4S3JLS2_9EURO|nr:hypothetical protein EYZ11_004834 [Aspergillus tanneri]